MPDGTVLGVYRKTHIPDGPGYTEKFYFKPGDTGFKVWETRYGTIGVGICWDQWYPETARQKPRADGCGSSGAFRPSSGPSRSTATSTRRGTGNARCRVMRAANMVPVVAANRIGREVGFGNGNPQQQGLAGVFYGSSFIADHTGVKLAEANRTDETILLHTFDLDAIRADRQSWGFFRDRRPEMYRTLLTSDGASSCYR